MRTAIDTSGTLSPEWWSVDKVAAVFDVSPKTVRRWCRDGWLEALQVGAHWRIAAETVREKLAKVAPHTRRS